MAKLKKSDIIKELTKMNISCSEDMKYSELQELYKSTKVIKLPKEELINSVYSYKPLNNETLIKDKSNKPLKSIKKPFTVKTNKVVYEEYISSGKYFEIYFGTDRVFSNKFILINNLNIFDDYFRIYDKNYSYQGARIKYI